MLVRALSDGEADALFEIFFRAVRETARRDYTEEQVRAWAPDDMDRAAFARARLRHPTWVAERDRRIAGFADLEPDGHVDMLFVHPEFQHKGVARALLAVVEAEARSRRLARLFVEASITARRRFEISGFVVIAEQTVTKRGVDLTNFRMEKRLGGPQ